MSGWWRRVRSRANPDPDLRLHPSPQAHGNHRTRQGWRGQCLKLREQLEKRYEVRVGDGRPPAAWMEGSEVGPYLRPVSRPGQRTLPESYGSPYGLLPLRQRIAGLLAERSIGAEPTQVLLTQAQTTRWI
jgi:DNA-binding transcriptional MocR family regulator